MTKELVFKKEFEDYILKQSSEEALNSLIPNTNEYIYLQFCEEYKKCIKSQKISTKLNSILKNAKNNSSDLLRALNTRKNLLEYDLPSTTQERKNEIINFLYQYYCDNTLNFDPPYFVRENNEKKNDMEIEESENESNEAINELTEEIIKQRVEKIMKDNDIEENFKNTPLKKRKELFLKYLTNDKDEIDEYFLNSARVPFYLLTKDEFSLFINFLNKCKFNIFNISDYMTIEQLERILKEVDNPENLPKKIIISELINKKYGELVKNAGDDLIKLKTILLEIYNNILIEYSSEYCCEILIYILKINKMTNIFEPEILIKYLKHKKDLFSNEDEEYENENEIKRIFNLNFIDIKNIKPQQFIEQLLIDFFIYTKVNMNDFKDYFDENLLKRLFYIAKLLKGEESLSPMDDRYITYSQYCDLAKKQEITICEHNPKKFEIEKEVKIDFDIKNIKNINVNIYEINTENYFLEKKTDIDNSINIEGLIADKNYDIKIEGTENPLKRIRKSITFDQIPKNKPGVYLIELLGDGISSRIIIKKGKLNLISRNTTKGLMCQIINEKNEILKDSKTFLYYKNTKFSCELNEGLIILPYKILSKDDNICVLVHDTFADIAKIDIKNEKYELKGYFNFLNESLIWDTEAKITFRPFLFVNGRESYLDNIKNGKITVDITKKQLNENIPNKLILENIVFNDDNKEYEFEVYIPSLISDLNFRFDCEIINSKGEKKNLHYEQNIEFYNNMNDINFGLLRKCGKKYYYDIIGRNGDKCTSFSNKEKEIELYTNYYDYPIAIKMIYDNEGKLNLGELKNVKKIKLENGVWYNLINKSKYCYPRRIDLIEGESFTLPIYSDCNEINLNDNYFILYYYINSESEPCKLLDIKKEIILKKLELNGDNKHFYEFKLGHNLKKGNYHLIFGEGLDKDLVHINIIVNVGKHWMKLENYIINSKGFVENSENKTPIYINKLNIDKKNNLIKFECAKTRRKIAYTHANIYLFQYPRQEPNLFFNEYYKILNEGTENIIIKNFINWENIYLSNKNISEEIEYALQRKTFEEQIGNSLPLPSLLLKRTLVQECFNENELLKEEGDYQNNEDFLYTGRSVLGRGRARKCPPERVGNKAARRSSGYHEIEINRDNNNFYYFLKNYGYTMNNIEPKNISTDEPNAKFEIKLEKNLLNKYTFLQIVLLDEKSISSNIINLSEENDKYKIETKDITNINALDSNKNFTEINKIYFIKKGETFNVNESSKYILIDSIDKLAKFYMLESGHNFKEDELKMWEKFKFIFSLDKLKENEFIENYNNVCGHEINLFLYFKFPELFNKYVKNNIKFKFEKTFIDYFLLDDYDTLIEYLTPVKINSLSTFELCLLIIKLIQKNPQDAEKIKNIIKSRTLDQENLVNHLLSNFNKMINMSSNFPNNQDNSNDSEMDEDEEENEQKEESGENLDEEESNSFVDIAQLDMKKRKSNYNIAVQNAENDIGIEYEKPGKVKEYEERHYFIKKYDINEIINPLWLDFAEFIIKEKTYKNFLSKNILYNEHININEIIFILSVIDLPITSQKHLYKRNKNSKNTSIISNSNIILFNKEISETQMNLNNKLLISQRINDEHYKENNININNCSINIKYSYQAIVTNISNKKLNFQLFLQIPKGAIGLNTTFYNNIFQIELKPYETKDYKIFFYFPKEGTFMQYYPVASQNNKIISVGNSLIYTVKKDYIPTQKIEFSGNKKYTENMRIEGKLRNILADNSTSSQDKLEKILNYFSEDIFNNEDIRNILYLLKSNKTFFIKLINILRNRGYYHKELWSFGFHHKDEKSISEYLSINNQIIQDLTYDFKSKLYSYQEINDARIHPHIEYNPIINARKHPFGKNNEDNELPIANEEFKETYEKFIIDLLPLRELRIKEKLQLTYYLIIQDRMNEALNIFNKIKKEEIEDNNNNNKSFKIQYDYIYAYLDFTFGYPEFKIAKSLCNYYKDFPLLHWKEKFEEIDNELQQYENKENRDNISMDIVEEEKDKKTLIKELKEKEPKLTIKIENKDGKVYLIHSNIDEINIKLYLIDLEILFTREPKISEIINKSAENNNDHYLKEKFGFVQPNYSETIKIPESKNNKSINSTIYEIPEIYKKKNLLIEVDYASIKLLNLYLNSNLNIIITESIGELQALDEKLKPVIKTYIKVYAKLDDEIIFYKDGYTDLNGSFNYLKLNTDLLKKVKKFYIYAFEMNHSDTIKECYPPKNIDNMNNEDIMELIRKEKRNERNLWKILNKKRKGPSADEIFIENKF